ncbi:MAG: hypothetical protein ACUVTL_01770 [Thermoproteota archaeon]
MIQDKTIVSLFMGSVSIDPEFFNNSSRNLYVTTKGFASSIELLLILLNKEKVGKTAKMERRDRESKAVVFTFVHFKFIQIDKQRSPIETDNSVMREDMI